MDHDYDEVAVENATMFVWSLIAAGVVLVAAIAAGLTWCLW